eukprot:m.126312 g.126312  ORF g.126312 m.126312 type:complete len:163 (+) comp15638_c3_seq1:681-1169(+)
MSLAFETIKSQSEHAFSSTSASKQHTTKKLLCFKNVTESHTSEINTNMFFFGGGEGFQSTHNKERESTTPSLYNAACQSVREGQNLNSGQKRCHAWWAMLQIPPARVFAYLEQTHQDGDEDKSRPDQSQLKEMCSGYNWHRSRSYMLHERFQPPSPCHELLV